MLRIFSYLPPLALTKAGLVCRHWQLLSSQPELCHTFPLDLLARVPKNSSIPVGKAKRGISCYKVSYHNNFEYPIPNYAELILFIW
jgi:hypothetical protein